MKRPPPDIATGRRPSLPLAAPRWTREQIRGARRVELAPLLLRRGLALRDRGGGNLEVESYNGLLLKASYWRWPDRDMAGNATCPQCLRHSRCRRVDFYVKVLGTSFHEAMEDITKG